MVEQEEEMSLSDVKFGYTRVVATPEELAVGLPKKTTDTGAHYRFEYKGIKLDPARIARVYSIGSGMQFTILKKVLRMGTAHKDKRQDLLDIIGAAERELELMEEDLRDYT